MAFQEAPGVLEAVVTGRMPDAQDWTNVFHFTLGDYTPGQTAADFLAASFDTAYTNLAPFMHTDWHCDNVQIYSLATFGAPAYNSVITVVGTGSGAPLPNAVALCCSWSTNLRGRNFRGRTFLGGWTEASSDGNGASAGAIAAAEDWAEDVLPLAPQVLSRTLNKQPRAQGIITPITAARFDNKWDTMRSRRLPGT